jgi:4-hydroxy-tetrahydrodipicolinate reductase
MTKIGLLGASGKMGSQIANLVRSEFSKQATLVAFASQGEPVEPLLETDIVIDFSSPTATLALIQAATQFRKLPGFVIGTTGFTQSQLQEIARLAEKAPVMMASNFSTGVMVLIEALKKASPALLAAGFQPSIHETHHHHKIDAPSGTALTLKNCIGPKVPIESTREGEVIGTHEITFTGPGESLRLIHTAQDRSIFARGAIRAALQLHQKMIHNSQLRGFQDV